MFNLFSIEGYVDTGTQLSHTDYFVLVVDLFLVILLFLLFLNKYYLNRSSYF